jgi:hypothetical protein
MDFPTLRKVHRSKALFCKGPSRGCLQAAFKLERLFVRNVAMCFDNTLALAGERKQSRRM